MRKIYIGLFLTALMTLTLELTLVRIFDVLWYPNMAYMVITLAVFSFGLAGVYSTFWPQTNAKSAKKFVCLLTVLLGLSAAAVWPVMNYFPFDYSSIEDNPLKIGNLVMIYFVLSAPFFIAGLILTALFTCFAASIQRLYFWDLVGAALGSLLLIPLLPLIGPVGILLIIAGLGFLSSILFSESRAWNYCSGVLAAALILTPWVVDEEFGFRAQINKRGLMSAERNNQIEHTVWDPISKIDIVRVGSENRLWIAYDGGTQSSYFYNFDGDYIKLRENIDKRVFEQFWGKGVLYSHFLKQDQQQEVLVIGSAGGQETKAALMYGASRVDGIELVGSVVELGKNQYADYTGNVFNDPRVNNQKGEGRSYLRSTEKEYDIIQIMSNHTSSSIGSGTGAMATTYLQTVEAYQEFFTHLKNNGILHINHHIYPRMITTAAQAWHELGRKDFYRHVLVIDNAAVVNYLPSLLIKASPWNNDEVDNLDRFIRGSGQSIVVDPRKPEWQTLPDDFFNGNLSNEMISQTGFRIEATTDNRPYFNFLRKHWGSTEINSARNVDRTTAGLLNSQLRGNIPMDIIHLIVTGVISIIFSALFIFVPWFFSDIRKTSSTARLSTLTYFACLGAGFILLELVFIHIFMKLIGYPLYAFSVVLFAKIAGNCSESTLDDQRVT